MCRSIKNLRRVEGLPPEREIDQAALQFVRKVSGYRVPSRANQAVFDQAVQEISAASRKLLGSLTVRQSTDKSGELGRQIRPSSVSRNPEKESGHRLTPV